MSEIDYLERNIEQVEGVLRKLENEMRETPDQQGAILPEYRTFQRHLNDLRTQVARTGATLELASSR